MAQIRTVIFDWSGTLVDDLPAVWRATNFVFSQAGVNSLTLDQFRAEFQLPFQTFYDRFTPNVPLPQLETWFHGHYREIQDSVVELPHARDFLLFLTGHSIQTFILSSVHPEHFEVQKRQTGLGDLLGRAYVGVWDKRAMIHQILEENHLVPDETLFIGDMEHDMETAHHGKVHSCAVLTGYNSVSQLRAAHPELIVEHLGELHAVLQASGLQFPVPLTAPESSGRGHPIVTVGALIRNVAGLILMIRTHKWSNLWGIPGGKTKYGETSAEALRREIKEETNLDVDGIEFVMVQDCVESTEFYRPAHFVLLNYVCQAKEPATVRLNEEANAFQWLTLEEAFRLPLNYPTLQLLKTVQERK